MIGWLIAAALLQAQPTPAAPNWRLFNHDGRGDGYIDVASLRREGNGFEAMIRIEFSSDRAAGVRSMTTRYLFDCQARTLVARHVTAFDSKGALLSDNDVPAGAPVAAPSGTPGAIVMDQYCTTAPPRDVT